MEELRPPNNQYYETRLPPEVLSQGDIFRDVPMPSLPEAVAYEPIQAERRGAYLTGEVVFVQAILISPTRSLRPSLGMEYAHPIATLCAVKPLSIAAAPGTDEEYNARDHDGLSDYMYLPEDADLGLAESVVDIRQAWALHREMLQGNRITQLKRPAAQQLMRKLATFYSRVSIPRGQFDPPQT